MIFISYSSKDNVPAEALCSGLESKELPCWIAPRDIMPGESYPSAIMRGIENAKIMIIIISGNSVMSKHVLNEVEQAFKREISIIPLRVDHSEPNGDLNYFLSLTQWVDAASGDMAPHVSRLADQIKILLSDKPRSPTTSVASVVNADSATAGTKNAKNNILKWSLSAVILAAVILVGVMFFNDKTVSVEATLEQYPLAKELSSVVPNKQLDVKVTIEPVQSSYKNGDNVVLAVSSNKPTWFAVIMHMNDGTKLLLYPNVHSGSGMREINAGETIKLGSEGSGFEYEISAPFGSDLVQVIASQRKQELFDLLKESELIDGTVLSEITAKAMMNYISRVKTRGITIRKEADLKNEGWGEGFAVIQSVKE